MQPRGSEEPWYWTSATKNRVSPYHRGPQKPARRGSRGPTTYGPELAAGGVEGARHGTDAWGLRGSVGGFLSGFFLWGITLSVEPPP